MFRPTVFGWLVDPETSPPLSVFFTMDLRGLIQIKKERKKELPCPVSPLQVKRCGHTRGVKNVHPAGRDFDL